MIINTTHLKLRRNLGILGILLPLILVAGNNFDIQSSISHFYYTRMSVFFTGVLCAFGLFLFSYRGYEKENEKISDNWLTNFAGVLAILTAFIPAACSGNGCIAPNSHNNEVFDTIHLICASGFLILMGWMSFFRFTKGNIAVPLKRKRNRLYRICGIGVWVALALLAIDIWLKLDLTGSDVFIGETVALLFFGTAWLVKSKALKFFGL